MASITDKFTRVINGTTRPVATTLSAQKLSGASSATVVSTTGWDTGTAVHGIMYRTDASGEKVEGSQIDWKGVISGTTISNFTVTAGTDDTYAVGTTVELAPTAAWGDDMATGLLVEHNADGTHGTITTDIISEHTSANGVTIDGLNLKDGKLNTNNSIVATNLTDGIVSASKLNLSPATDLVATSQSTTTQSFTDLSTVGPAATVTIGANGLALVSIYAFAINSAANTSRMGFAASGANTIAADAARSLEVTGTNGMKMSASFLLTGLTSGSTTFTAKYMVNGNTGSWADRRITVIPL